MKLLKWSVLTSAIMATLVASLVLSLVFEKNSQGMMHDDETGVVHYQYVAETFAIYFAPTFIIVLPFFAIAIALMRWSIRVLKERQAAG